MADDLTGWRLEDVKDHIEQDFDLLKDYEDELRYEKDPRNMAKFEREIERQRKSLARYWKEYKDLKKQAEPAQIHNLADLLQKKEAKLDAFQKRLNQKLPTKIQVSRDFTIGDTSGQIAFGTGNRQYQNCVFNFPDGSTLSGQSWLYTQGIRPSTDPAKIFGRQEELEKIDEFFKHNSALALTGFRGTGKSTLASMYIDRMEKRGEFAGIYWRKVDETIDISDVVSSFFSVIGKPIKYLERYKIGDQLTLLFRELNAAPYFLVLDNFEILLDPQTNEPEAHKLGFSELIENATENAGVSRFLFTSWESPASERGIRPTCYTIGGLDPSAAVQLLKRHGLTEPDNELEKAVKLAGGHPLALILLTQLVIGGADTLSGLLKDTTLWIGEKGEVAERILNKVYNKRLDENERKLLQYVSMYRVPVPLQAIIIAAHDSQWTEAAVRKTA